MDGPECRGSRRARRRAAEGADADIDRGTAGLGEGAGPGAGNRWGDRVLSCFSMKVVLPEIELSWCAYNSHNYGLL